MTPGAPLFAQRPLPGEASAADALLKEKEGERAVRRMRGTPLSVGLREALLAELRGTDWIRTMRERRSVNAEGYVTVERPGAKQYGTNVDALLKHVDALLTKC